MTTIEEPQLHDWASELIERSLHLARSSPPAALAEVLNMCGEFHRATGDDAAAGGAYEEALAVAAEVGNLPIEGVSLANLAYVACHAGRYEHARQLSRTALRLTVRSGCLDRRRAGDLGERPG